MGEKTKPSRNSCWVLGDLRPSADWLEHSLFHWVLMSRALQNGEGKTPSGQRKKDPRVTDKERLSAQEKV